MRDEEEWHRSHAEILGRDLGNARSELAAEKKAHQETAEKLEEARREAEECRFRLADAVGTFRLIAPKLHPFSWEPTPVGSDELEEKQP